MSRFERYGTRDLTYSNWHRQFCPDRATMIDVDGLEYCRRCRSPLALIETAQDVRQAFKPVAALEQLSLAANVPAFCVLYIADAGKCTPDGRGRCRKVGCAHGIAAFRVRRIRPNPTDFQEWTPKAFADYLTRVHDAHEELVCQAVIGMDVV
jgi:hypothetical protein